MTISKEQTDGIHGVCVDDMYGREKMRDRLCRIQSTLDVDCHHEMLNKVRSFPRPPPSFKRTDSK